MSARTWRRAAQVPIVYRLGRHPFKVQRRVRLPLGAPFKTDATPTVAFFVRPTYRESRIPPPPPDFEGSYGRGVIGRAHRDQISEKSLRGKMPSTAVLLSWRPTTLHWLFYTVQSRQAPLGKMPVDCQIRAHDFALFASGQPPGSRARVHGPKRIVRMHGSAGLYVEMLIPKAGRMKVRQLLRPLTHP